ncbi:MAG: cell division protein FtsW [Actinomycetota bacterium]|nr:cell division protein FtsW [Actinomycetota bacterium]
MAGGGRPGEARTAARGRNAWFARLDYPLAPYYLILGSTVALVVVGLVMVLSSSSVESLRETEMHSSFAYFSKQALFAVVGLPAAWIASRLTVPTWRRLSWVMLAGTTVLLCLVPFIGIEVGGNKNWIVIGGFTLQPSETAKFALLVWAASVLSAKHQLLGSVSHALIPVLPVAGVLLLLILVGRDLGTAMILMGIVFGVVFVAGAPLRTFAVLGLGALATVAVLVTTSENRMNRVTSWLSGTETQNYYGSEWQSIHGAFALASGGWWGVGLGGSKEKWLWLPEAHNDFIFAIIGEDLGLPGTLSVLGLFGLLGLGLMRLVVSTDDLFVQIATGGVLLWVVGQAVVNIGAVIGMFPVIGVPLPLVSSGGSALVMTMIALGMVLGFARRVPGAPEALTSGSGVVRRSLAVLPRRQGFSATRHRAGRP